MSYQRAVANCKICYNIFREARAGPGMKESCLAQQRTARNEAMKALENEAVNRIATKEERYRFERADSLMVKVTEGLTACMNCDFQSAKIAEIFRPTDQGEAV